jgi:hypothetical protein
MKQTFLFALITLLSFTFCKKKESTPAAASTTGSSTAGSTSGGTTSGGSICDLQTTKYVGNNNGIITMDSFVVASFYSAPVSSVVPTNVSGGTVKLNGNTIPYNGSNYSITNNLNFNISGTLNWNVTGSGTVTAFSHTYIASYPKYTGGNLLPDTCIRANGISLNISGVSNFTGAAIVATIYSGGSSAYKYIFGSSGTINFTATELASFPTNSVLTIILNFTNFTNTNYGGLKQGYSNGLQYTKFSYLK